MRQGDYRRERLRQRAEKALAVYDVSGWKRQVLTRFLMEIPAGWHTHVHRFLPNNPTGQPDVILVGPMGVYAILLRDDEPTKEALGAMVRFAGDLFVGARVRESNVSEAVVRPVLILPPNRDPAPRSTGDHLSVPAPELDRILTLGERRLDKRDARALVSHVEGKTRDYVAELLPGAEDDSRTQNSDDELFDVEEVKEDRFDRAMAGPFESWLTFLDDSQFALARRNYNGPARISGPAGTGKSVVALHRLVHLAKRSTGPLLFTTYARNLPGIMRRRFNGLAPELSERVSFSTLHAWARSFLRHRRGGDVPVDNKVIQTCFSLAWSRVGKQTKLEQLHPNSHYWQDEIDRVIKGRGLVDLDAYQAVRRTGRGTSVDRGADRELVWRLYEEYERIRQERGVLDFNDLLFDAWRELEAQPHHPEYAAVVVDEVQDITLVGLRLLYALAGDRPNGLLLAGDGQQQVYPGGWRLSDAGIPIRGRGEVLRNNYRNASRILDVAKEYDATNQVDDLDGDVGVTLREAIATLRGGNAVRWRGSEADHENAVMSAIGQLGDISPDDIAVLTFSGKEAGHWRNRLSRAGFAVSDLERYEGERDETIKVGTVIRAKGLEFRAIVIPQLTDAAADWESRERSQRARLVALTRARDHLWVGFPEAAGV